MFVSTDQVDSFKAVLQAYGLSQSDQDAVVALGQQIVLNNYTEFLEKHRRELSHLGASLDVPGIIDGVSSTTITNPLDQVPARAGRCCSCTLL